MSKTPEQVVSEAIESHWKTTINMHGPVYASGTAFGVVAALRSAGWLRDAPDDRRFHVGCLATEASLRDEVASRDREIDTLRTCNEQLGIDLKNSTRLTDAESALCFAVLAYRSEMPGSFAFCSGAGDVWKQLSRAVDALAAERAPKVEAKPKYRVVYLGLNTSHPWGVERDNGSESRHSRRDSAEAECARLNAAEGA